MTQIKGIYAAGLSILDKNLSLNINKTAKHAERLIEQGCHGVAIFGSTGQAQLISISEKIKLLNCISDSKYKENYLIGTGLNSLSETINLMKVASSLKFNDFLVPLCENLDSVMINLSTCSFKILNLTSSIKSSE